MKLKGVLCYYPLPLYFRMEWKETARWIKFEEEVEEGSGRWGRPHISALAFHSLVELKRGLDDGG